MEGDLSGRPPRAGKTGARDRLLAWLVTGRPARFASFALDFGAALRRGVSSVLRRNPR
jgi:hypothetical protein